MTDTIQEMAGVSLYLSDLYYWLVACRLTGDISPEQEGRLYRVIKNALEGTESIPDSIVPPFEPQEFDEFVSGVTAAIARLWLTPDQAVEVFKAYGQITQITRSKA